MFIKSILQTMGQNLFEPKQSGVILPLIIVLSLALTACAGASMSPTAESDFSVPAAEESVEEVTIVAEAEVAPLPRQQIQSLRAGEVDDNAHWNDYLQYRHNYYGAGVHNRDISERYIIEVTDAQGDPILDAQVEFLIDKNGQLLKIYEAKTYANGQILFHPQTLGINLAGIQHFTVYAQKDGLATQFSLPRFEQHRITPWTINLNQQLQAHAPALDVLFLIDATGSMADEINKIEGSIFDVAARIETLSAQTDVRYGMVTYRDRGESYVSQNYDFSSNVTEFHGDLNTITADGGGDYPEALNEGLHNAIHNVSWSNHDTIKLIFLVADAPPHLDYANDYDYALEMEEAARRGIKIFPIASSGLDDQGEYIFRQLAQFTQGRFIFLTYEGATNSGSPGNSTTHHVDSYSVQNLDALLVRLVQEELAYQIPQLGQVRVWDDTVVAVVKQNAKYSYEPERGADPAIASDWLMQRLMSVEVVGIVLGGLLGTVFLTTTGTDLGRNKKIILTVLSIITLIGLAYFLIIV